MAPNDPHLQQFNGEVGRVLAIVAHPDDIEYEAAAAVALWTQAGQSVAYLIATHGEAGIENMPAVQCAPIRVREQRASAAVVGVHSVEFLNHVDGAIRLGNALTADVVNALKRDRPDTVLLTNHHASWPSGNENSLDHQHVGSAVFSALDELGDEHTVKRILVAGSSKATHVIDVSTTAELAVDSLAQQATYLASLGDDETADPAYVRREMRNVGEQNLGSGSAIAVELIEL